MSTQYDGMPIKQLSKILKDVTTAMARKADEAEKATAARSARVAEFLKTELQLPQAKSDTTVVADNGNGKPVAKKAARRSRRRVAVKFRDPANPSHTWSGRGKTPRWLAAAEKAGTKRDEFKVAQ
jgi:DNA-binding protein H-NS